MKQKKERKVVRGKGAKKVVEVTEDIKTKKDKLAMSMYKMLNDSFGTQVAYFLDEGNAPTEVKEWISTGDDILDLRISNRPNGGIPVGKITEITGLNSSGKSLLLSHIVAETQKRGGVAAIFDTESAYDEEFARAIGVDTANLLYVQSESNTLEEIFEAIEKLIMNIRESNQDRLVTICIDSIAGATTKVEAEGNYDKAGWNTGKAIIISQAMRKITNLIAKQRIAFICTNQLREKLGVMFGDKYCVDPYTTKIKIKYKI